MILSKVNGNFFLLNYVTTYLLKNNSTVNIRLLGCRCSCAFISLKASTYFKPIKIYFIACVHKS